MDKITIEISDLSKVSDGYHTIAELYDHRCLLFINLVLLHLKNDGCAYWVEEHYEGWDLLLMKETESATPPYKHYQISYHVPIKYRNLYRKRVSQVEPDSHHFDGHTSQDVLDRLVKYARKGISVQEAK